MPKAAGSEGGIATVALRDESGTVTAPASLPATEQPWSALC